MNRIQTCNYEFRDDDWEGVSREAQKWIERLFELDPEKRMTPSEALEDKWLLPLAHDKDLKRYKLHYSVMTNLKKYSSNCGLHKLILPLFT